MVQPRVRVVILNYNGGTLLHRAVASVVATKWPHDALDVVVIDNASSDGSLVAVERDFPDVTVQRLPRNAGFPANNVALQETAAFDYAALLNPDAFVEPGWLAPLVDALEGDAILGAACPLMLFSDADEVNNAGCEVLDNGYARDRAMGEVDLSSLGATDVFAWSGGAVLLRAAYLRDVGLFEERFFLYYEDIDLAWRGRRRGWRYRFVPESVVRHEHGATVGIGSRTHQYFSERNRLLTLVRNAPTGMAVQAILRYPLSTASYVNADAVRPLLHGRRPRFGTAGLRIVAFGGFLRQLPAALAARRRLRRRATVPDQELVAELVRVDHRRRK